MSVICCPFCDHQSEDPNAWKLTDSHPVDCQACGKTFSLNQGEIHAAESRKKAILAEIENPTPMPRTGSSANALLSTQTCPFCKSVIDATAIKCPRCQEWLEKPSRQSIVAPVHTFHPGVAAVLSLVFPGLGQIYKTQIALGIIWLILVVIGYAFFIIPGVILHLICITEAASSTPVRVK